MAAQDNNSIQAWRDDWGRMERQISALRKKLDIATFDGNEIIGNLITCFEEFAYKQMDYFCYGFTKEHLTEQWEKYDDVTYELINKGDPATVDYPENHVRGVTMDQIDFDFQALDSVITKRIDGTEFEKEILEVADYLAYSALKPACSLLKKNEKGIDKFPLVFSYYPNNKPGEHKTISIRLIPYANVALIGIPNPVVEYGNLLAIPHEVGHYVFWHGEKTRKGSYLDVSVWNEISAESILNKTHDENLAIDATVFNYQEEIFADVFSALIGGPLTALSSQLYQKDLDENLFFKDDSDHPISAIRPYIYTDTLEILKQLGKPGNLDDWKNQLIKLWETNQRVKNTKKLNVKPKKLKKFLALINNDQTIHPQVTINIGANADGLGKPVDVNKLKARISDVVEAIVQDLYRQHLETSDFWPSFSNKNLDDVRLINDFPLEERNTLYSEFIDNVKDFRENGIPELGIIPDLHRKPYAQIVKDWVEKWSSIDQRWIVIFKADGWTTEGPSNPWD